jgi:hypothetical protein
MPEASTPKTLIQDKNGDYYLISKDAIPVPVPPDTALVNIVNTTNTSLTNYFTDFTPPGVKVGITIVDF